MGCLSYPNIIAVFDVTADAAAHSIFLGAGLAIGAWARNDVLPQDLNPVRRGCGGPLDNSG